MREREYYHQALIAAETMYHLWEAGSQEGEPDLDGMMRRLKDLSAYSLTHAEIMYQREVVELLALAMFLTQPAIPGFTKTRSVFLSFLSKFLPTGERNCSRSHTDAILHHPED